MNKKKDHISFLTHLPHLETNYIKHGAVYSS